MAKFAALGLWAAGFALAACVSAEPPPAVVDAGESDAGSADGGNTVDSGDGRLRPTRCDTKSDTVFPFNPSEIFDARSSGVGSAATTRVWQEYTKPAVTLLPEPATAALTMSGKTTDKCNFVLFDGKATFASAVGNATARSITPWLAPSGLDTQGTTLTVVVDLKFSVLGRAGQPVILSRLRAVSATPPSKDPLFEGLQITTQYADDSQPDRRISLGAMHLGVIASAPPRSVFATALLKEANGVKPGLHVISLTASGGRIRLIVDDRDPVVADPISTEYSIPSYGVSVNDFSPLRLGGNGLSDPFEGGIGFVAVYANPLTLANETALVTQLMGEWGVATWKKQ
jgi:hypothetical protein